MYLLVINFRAHDCNAAQRAVSTLGSISYIQANTWRLFKLNIVICTFRIIRKRI